MDAVRFSDMPRAGRLLLLLRDWFCYQKWAGLDDTLRLSSGVFAARAGVTGNSAGSPCGFIRAGCWAAAGSSLSLDLLWCRVPLRLSTLITVKYIKDKINMRENTTGSAATSRLSQTLDVTWNVDGGKTQHKAEHLYKNTPSDIVQFLETVNIAASVLNIYVKIQ